MSEAEEIFPAGSLFSRIGLVGVYLFVALSKHFRSRNTALRPRQKDSSGRFLVVPSGTQIRN